MDRTLPIIFGYLAILVAVAVISITADYLRGRSAGVPARRKCAEVYLIPDDEEGE